MKIKFAKDIISEIETRGSVEVPNGYVTGEAFEKWMYEEDAEEEMLFENMIIDIESNLVFNAFYDELGEAA